MVSIRNPETMTAEERQREVAQLLARALVRHVRLARSRTSDAASAGPQNDLDLSPETRLSATTNDPLYHVGAWYRFDLTFSDLPEAP